MNCPECGTADSQVVKTMKGAVNRRQRRCPCGIEWNTSEVVDGSSIRHYQRRLMAISGDIPPPVATPLGQSGPGGVGGGLSPVLDLRPDLLRIPRSISAEIVSKPRARSRKRATVEYSLEFERFWSHTGRCHGNKGPAALAFLDAMRECSLERLEASWTAYMASSGPVRGFVQNVATWLNGKGYETSWLPAARPSAYVQKQEQADEELREIIRQQNEQEAARARGR